MTRIETPHARCRAAFARADITPPVGMYHRMWGAATHDVSTGVHRPLLATTMFLEAHDGSGRQLVLSLDHCLLDNSEIANIRRVVSEATGLEPTGIQIALSHTHGAGWMSRSRAHLPGGEMIGPYLDRIAETCALLAVSAKATARPASIVYGHAKCDLAAHRDFWDVSSQQFVCGFNPDGPTDDTVVLAKILAESGEMLGTIVNYACHPTTLAWQNSLISPDYIGAMREVVEQHTSQPCLFILGACGDLGPREGYVGDPTIADRNGRQLGFAALSGLEAINTPADFHYSGPVLSGATLGAWEHRDLPTARLKQSETWKCRSKNIDLPYRADLPTLEQTKSALHEWQHKVTAATDAKQIRDCRAMVEQMNRQITRLEALVPGRVFPLPVEVWRLGGALWIFTPGELYHVFQITLRKRFPSWPIIVGTVTNGWQPGYIPSAESYGKGIYQEVIAAVAPESLALLIEAVAEEFRVLIEP